MLAYKPVHTYMEFVNASKVSTTVHKYELSKNSAAVTPKDPLFVLDFGVS